MKGVIFNVVEEVVLELHGPAAWDAIIEAAGATGSYTALGNYEDGELLAIVGAACAALDVGTADLLRLVGEYGLPHLASRMPGEIAAATDARSFLLRVNDIIHPEVLKLYPEANPPSFEFEERGDDLFVRYRSARRLDALAHGLMLGCGRLYDDPMEVIALGSVDDAATFMVRFGDRVGAEDPSTVATAST